MGFIYLLQEGNISFPTHLEAAEKNGYEGIVTPINYLDGLSDLQRQPMIRRQEEFSYPDLLLKAAEWNHKVVLMLSDTIDCDSQVAVVRKSSEQTLKRDIEWAEYLQYGGYTMIQLKSQHNTNLARVVSNNIKGLLLVKVPMYNADRLHAVWRRDVEKEDLDCLDKEDTWNWWNQFRRTADFHPKIKVVLEVNEHDLPSLEVILRWMGEPIEAIILPTTIFTFNKENFPILPEAWQEVLSLFLRIRVSLFVATFTNEDRNLKCYARYLNDFMDRHRDTHKMRSLEDKALRPLQPLCDDLNARKCEVLEGNHVKYRLYQDAIEAALKDLVSENEKEEKILVIMVLGAGRGTLVRAALNAANKTERKVRVYIIENNLNAVRTLSKVTEKLWKNEDVHIFSKNICEFPPPEKADILICELLGSFGENELLPECLDCAQELLKTDGICIPGKSTSFINPIMSSILFNNVREKSQKARNESFCRLVEGTYYTNEESNYRVLLKNFYNIAMPQELFEFEYPNTKEPIDNSRYKMLRFQVTLDCVLNGIAGYFDTMLYKDIRITPEIHTHGLSSTYHMYFSFSEPIDVKKGQDIEIQIWRHVSKKKIWYEWCLSSPYATHIHNLDGRSCTINR